MSAKVKVLRMLIKWLWMRWPYLVLDITVGPKAHIHRNPVKKKVPQ
jgi:hypothetical protein